jgi:hypothetical protein
MSPADPYPCCWATVVRVEGTVIFAHLSYRNDIDMPLTLGSSRLRSPVVAWGRGPAFTAAF